MPSSPFIQGLLAAAPEALQLICKEVQQQQQQEQEWEQPVVSRVRMDGRILLSAQTFFAPATSAALTSCCPPVCLPHLSPLCTRDPQLPCNCQLSCLVSKKGDAGTKTRNFQPENLKVDSMGCSSIESLKRQTPPWLVSSSCNVGITRNNKGNKGNNKGEMRGRLNWTRICHLPAARS